MAFLGEGRIYFEVKGGLKALDVTRRLFHVICFLRTRAGTISILALSPCFALPAASGT